MVAFAQNRTEDKMIEIRNETEQLEPKIIVIGVGGGGNNAIIAG